MRLRIIFFVSSKNLQDFSLFSFINFMLYGPVDTDMLDRLSWMIPMTLKSTSWLILF